MAIMSKSAGALILILNSIGCDPNDEESVVDVVVYLMLIKLLHDAICLAVGKLH